MFNAEDPQFLNRCYLETGPKLYRFFYRALQHEDLSRELVQQAFVVFMEKKARFESEGQARSYLFGIAKNQIYKTWREWQRHEKEEVLELECGPSQNDQTFWVRRAIGKLPPELRLITLLKEYEGFRYHEIADILEIPVGTVRSRLHRARAQLAEILFPDTREVSHV